MDGCSTQRQGIEVCGGSWEEEQKTWGVGLDLSPEGKAFGHERSPQCIAKVCNRENVAWEVRAATMTLLHKSCHCELGGAGMSPGHA